MLSFLSFLRREGKLWKRNLGALTFMENVVFYWDLLRFHFRSSNNPAYMIELVFTSCSIKVNAIMLIL